MESTFDLDAKIEALKRLIERPGTPGEGVAAQKALDRIMARIREEGERVNLDDVMEQLTKRVYVKLDHETKMWLELFAKVDQHADGFYTSLRRYAWAHDGKLTKKQHAALKNAINRFKQWHGDGAQSGPNPWEHYRPDGSRREPRR